MFDWDAECEISWVPRLAGWYNSKGYPTIKRGSKFVVKIKDLPPNTNRTFHAVCDECGKVFPARPKRLKRNEELYNGKHLCQGCSSMAIHGESRGIERRQKIEKFCKIKGYTILSPQEDFEKSCEDKIKFLCPIHGAQEKKIKYFLGGTGCVPCSLMELANRKFLNADDVEKDINSYNGNVLLNKEEYKYSTLKNLKIRCSCGNVFVVSYDSYMSSDSKKCKSCSSKESSGEQRIRIFLEKNDIKFVQEKRFPDCRDNKPLPFDFYLPDSNCIIEFDGQGHYLKMYNKGSLEKTQKHDIMKNKYCESRGIHMIRIPYWEGNHIEEILSKELKIA